MAPLYLPRIMLFAFVGLHWHGRHRLALLIVYPSLPTSKARSGIPGTSPDSPPDSPAMVYRFQASKDVTSVHKDVGGANNRSAMQAPVQSTWLVSSRRPEKGML